MLKTATLTVRVDENIKEKVKQLAAEKDQTVSKWLYNMLVKQLEEIKEEK